MSRFGINAVGYEVIQSAREEEYEEKGRLPSPLHLALSFHL